LGKKYFPDFPFQEIGEKQNPGDGPAQALAGSWLQLSSQATHELYARAPRA
jgi:hypothetical protein